ncbi:MAG: transposase, partial [Verrucomicrobiota bacterium]
AKEDQYAAVMVEGGTVLVTMKWKHPMETAEVVELFKALPASEVGVVMESSGRYGDAIRAQLENAGLEVYLVSAKRVHDAAEVYDGVPSMHDAKAAAIIAKLHFDGATRHWPEMSEERRSLAAAVSTMEMFAGQYQRNLNRLEAELARAWPEITQEIALDSATLLRLIAAYGAPRIMAMRPKLVRELFGRVSGSLLKEQKRERILELAGTTIGVRLVDEERESLKHLAQEILRNRRELAKAKKRVEELGQSDETIKNMSSTVGKTTAAVLSVRVGDPRIYESVGAYVKAYGLGLKERSSGKSKGQLRITKRGPGDARQYLWMAVLRLIQWNPHFRAWYARKVARDGGQHKGKAVVALMRKLVAGLWHVGHGKPFEARLLFDESRLGLVTGGR